MMLIPIIAQSEEMLQIEIVDGQYVVKRVQLKSSVPPPPTPHAEPNEPAISGILDLWVEAVKTASYMEEGDRMANARKEAIEKARVSIESGNRYAIVPVTADSPLQIEEEIKVNNYKIGRAETGDDKTSILGAAFGSKNDELMNQDEVTSTMPTYLRYILFAEKESDGTIKYRNLTKTDQEEFVMQQSKDAEDASTQVAHQKEMERLDAEKRQNALSEQQRKNSQAAYEAEQSKRKAEEQAARKRADEEMKRRQTLAEKAAERDSICANGRTSACIYKDDQVTNDYEFAQKSIKTGDCAAPNPDSSGHGACSPGAPPCIFCNFGKALVEQQRYETYIAANATIRTSLMAKGKGDGAINLNIKNFVESKRGREQFGLKGFERVRIK
jgi:hypothetical protein